MKRLVIGILAHVDSGKTTLSEGMLYLSGVIKKLGRVDHKDAFLDTYSLERERGITIFSKQALIALNDTEMTLLDTPGHVDFSPEMERALQVMDYAVLVISGVDGVQSHTETLWRLLQRHRIPTFIFVNKMDISQRDEADLTEELKSRLSDGCVNFSLPEKERDEELALCGEEILGEFLEGKIEEKTLISAIKNREVFPCCFGSALKLSGVEDFLGLLEKYTESPEYKKEFGARVFKIARDDAGNRLTYMKITGGSLKVKTLLSGGSGENEWSEKADQIRLYSGSRYQGIETAECGTVCAVTGLSKTRPGDGLGSEKGSEAPLLEPVLTYRLELPAGINVHEALGRLRMLEEEEPALHIAWNEVLQEIHVQLMGEVQLEVIKSLITERFGMEVSFGQGSIVYKETIAAPVEGVGHFEPLRHYAEVVLRLEPGERGSGLWFSSDCSEDLLDRNWQRLILTHLSEKVHLGVLTGSPITDMKISLVMGRAHKKHTEGGDFRQATYRAVRQGLMCAESVLLEPFYEFRLEVPAENIGRAMSDFQQMYGSFGQPEIEGEYAVLCGRAPVSCMRDYQKTLLAYSHGKGRLICTPGGYDICHNAEEVTAQCGYDPQSDLENTPDSVFCAHGAGFSVPWNEVRDYMHSETEDFDEEEYIRRQETPEERLERQTAAYCAVLAQDKELLAIFERTYGKVNRDPRRALKTVKQPQRPYSAEKPIEGPEYILVDGYNIIFAWDELKKLAKESIDDARSRLIDIMCNYRGFRQCELILVFDAYKVKGNPGEVERVHNISVVYTKEAETADMYIEKVTHQLGRKHKVRVATSDGMEQLIILGHGALRMSAGEFHDEVLEVERAIKSFLLSRE